MEGQTQNKMAIRRKIPKPQFSILQFVLLLFPLLFFRSFLFHSLQFGWWLSGTDRAGTRVHSQGNKVYNKLKNVSNASLVKRFHQGEYAVSYSVAGNVAFSFWEPMRHLSEFEQSLIVGEMFWMGFVCYQQTLSSNAKYRMMILTKQSIYSTEKIQTLFKGALKIWI